VPRFSEAFIAYLLMSVFQLMVVVKLTPFVPPRSLHIYAFMFQTWQPPYLTISP